MVLWNRGAAPAEKRKKGRCLPQAEFAALSITMRLSAANNHYEETPPLHFAFVGGRSVNARHRNIVHAQINTELRTVMNNVIHYEAAQKYHTRHHHDRLSATQQLPVLHQVFVAGIGAAQSRARFADFLIERVQQLLA